MGRRVPYKFGWFRKREYLKRVREGMRRGKAARAVGVSVDTVSIMLALVRVIVASF